MVLCVLSLQYEWDRHVYEKFENVKYYQNLMSSEYRVTPARHIYSDVCASL